MAATNGKDNQSGSARRGPPRCSIGLRHGMGGVPGLHLRAFFGLQRGPHHGQTHRAPRRRTTRRRRPVARGHTLSWLECIHQLGNAQTGNQALGYDLGHACPWRKLGAPKLERPVPSASYLDLRLRKVSTLLQAGAAAEWTAEDRSTAEQAITVMRTAFGSVAEALPEVVRARSQEQIGLAPAHAEPSPSLALLRYLDGLAAQKGPTWQVAATLSNVQAMNLADFPSVFMWSPGDHAQLGRLLSSYQAAAALGFPIPDLSFLTLCDAFPGVTSPEVLMDLWRPPSVQDRWQHIRESLELYQEPDRCVITGPIGPRVVTKSILMATMSATPVSTPAVATSWRPAWLTVATGPVLLIDGPADQLHLLQHASAEVVIPHTLRWEGPLRSHGTTPQDKRPCPVQDILPARRPRHPPGGHHPPPVGAPRPGRVPHSSSGVRGCTRIPQRSGLRPHRQRRPCAFAC